MPPPRTLVPIVVFGGYLALAFVVWNAYPISRFDMYAGAPASRAPSRVIARDARGAAHEVDEYVAWRCEGRLVGDACRAEWPFAATAYLDRSAAAWVAGHGAAAATGEPVELVRRIYRLSERGGPPAVHDCVLERCRAVLR